MRGRGVFVCISPWNFPLAIFTGQVAAALAAGNAVLAKPAEQTPLVAFRAVQLLMEAGVPGEVLQFLPGDGATVGGRAVADPRVAGVAFTGSTETARVINRSLAGRDGAIGTLIAETGGQNAMFVDSSALPEQVVKDAAFSAFNSAGQRCSALRLLCLQTEAYARRWRALGLPASRLAVSGNMKYDGVEIGDGLPEHRDPLVQGERGALAAAVRDRHQDPTVRQLFGQDRKYHQRPMPNSSRKRQCPSKEGWQLQPKECVS